MTTKEQREKWRREAVDMAGAPPVFAGIAIEKMAAHIDALEAQLAAARDQGLGEAEAACGMIRDAKLDEAIRGEDHLGPISLKRLEDDAEVAQECFMCIRSLRTPAGEPAEGQGGEG